MFTCCSGPVDRGKACRLCLREQARLHVFLQLHSSGTGVLGSCPCCAVGPVFLLSWAWGLFVVVPNGEQVTSAKKKRAAEPVAVATELGWSRSRSQSVAWSPIVVLWPGLWGASSLGLGWVCFFGGFGCFGFFLSPSPNSVGRERGDARTPSPAV